ncbi:RraA family protein [Sinorhizobium sp. RAC02]|uniref:RraA family protein n=1 Tax=Sinorhizobium sp. RAC02 TaxID=1842534 RepID=UPI00083DBD17|nr:RraA family protein [Sinorhizobium sp. RAC02]AOF94163.1 demethylmenaquinone methyltransferase family protein [Sinorhizobium sp. RAC02]
MKQAIAQAIATGVGVGQISDAMDELGLPQNAGGGYRLLGSKGGTVFGRAFTLRQELAEPGKPSIVRQGEAALSLASPGDILVIDAGCPIDIATWGEGHSLRAQINGLSGVVLHGATRDAEALATSPLPVLCRGTSPLRSKRRMNTVSIGEPVTLAGVKIHPGDLLAFSVDGLACVPANKLVEVLVKACEIQVTEQKRDIKLRQAFYQACGNAEGLV